MADYRQNRSSDERSRSTGQSQYRHIQTDEYQSYQGQTAAVPGSAYYGQQSIHPPKKKKGGVWRVVFWIALIVFIGSLIALGVIVHGYMKGQATYTELSNTVFEEPADPNAITLADMKVDWDALRAINSDIVGWIYVPGTNINYPIVQGNDNDRYLYYNFYGEYDVIYTGTIFLAAENAADFSDANNIIYGHHMNDGSMFSAIDEMTSQEVFDARQTIYVLTPEGNYRLKPFSIVITTGSDTLAQPAFGSSEEFHSYIQDKLNRSEVSPSPDTPLPQEMSKIFTLATCNYSLNDGRAVLFATVVESTVAGGASETPEGEMINPDDVASVENATEEI